MTCTMSQTGPRKAKNVPAKGASKSKKTKSKKTSGLTKKDVLELIDDGREIKRLWGEIAQTDEGGNLLSIPNGNLIPNFVFGDSPSTYVTSNLNLTHQGLENENRIGNVIKPKRFTMKGYAYVTSQKDNAEIVGYDFTHVRMVVGFRRQAGVLSPSQSNLMMQGGTEVGLQDDYRDIINGFNWKEFRPFYDKTMKVTPLKRNSDNFQQPFVPNYFHFNIDYKFSPTADNLVSLEDENGSTSNAYNNNNIYCLFLARQMNDASAVNHTLRVYGTSLFQFTDA